MPSAPPAALTVYKWNTLRVSCESGEGKLFLTLLISARN